MTGEGEEGEGQVDGKARRGKAGRGEWEGLKGREISPARSFLEVGAYANGSGVIMLTDKETITSGRTFGQNSTPRYATLRG